LILEAHPLPTAEVAVREAGARRLDKMDDKDLRAACASLVVFGFDSAGRESNEHSRRMIAKGG